MADEVKAIGLLERLEFRLRSLEEKNLNTVKLGRGTLRNIIGTLKRAAHRVESLESAASCFQQASQLACEQADDAVKRAEEAEKRAAAFAEVCIEAERKLDEVLAAARIAISGMEKHFNDHPGAVCFIPLVKAVARADVEGAPAAPLCFNCGFDPATGLTYVPTDPEAHLVDMAIMYEHGFADSLKLRMATNAVIKARREKKRIPLYPPELLKLLAAALYYSFNPPHHDASRMKLQSVASAWAHSESGIAWRAELKKAVEELKNG